MKSTPSDKKKILVPVDGSERALATIRYIARFKPFAGTKVVLFNVFNKVPDYYWDLTNEPMMIQRGGGAHLAAWESHNRDLIETFMKKSTALLRTSGFKPEDIIIKIQNRKKGIARDIIAEARKGYAAVVTRRRGFSRVPGLLVGSTADKLLSALDFVPLFFVGKEPPTNKILIAMDTSDSAMKAVEYIAETVGPFGYEFTLIHVVRQNEFLQEDQSTNEIVIQDQNLIHQCFNQAKEKLVQAGANPETVDTKIVTGVGSRAGTIAREAAAGGYSTIVLGRRGLSRVKAFLVGRVSKKVVYAANKRTVCIV
ncbi:MAG: universal stress protein [Pseudomonadota bacterium]